MKQLEENNTPLSESNNTLQTGQIEIKAYPDDNNKIGFSVDTARITIDWGDGNIEEATPKGNKRSLKYKFKHTYPNYNLQTIRINAERMTEFEWRWGNFPELQFGDCPELEKICCYSRNLNSLDVSKCVALRSLYCWNNQLTYLNVSKCTSLNDLKCGGNQLTYLDVSKCTALTCLDCGGWGDYFRDNYSHQLTYLNINECTALTELYCGNNSLTSLDVGKCTVLTTLNCATNKLIALEVSKLKDLSGLVCSGNQLSASALNTLFNSLPTRKQDDEAVIWFEDNPGYDTCDKTIFEKKGWVEHISISD